MSYTRLHRDIVIEAILGEIAQDLVDIPPGPRVAKIGDELSVFRTHSMPPLTLRP